MSHDVDKGFSCEGQLLLEMVVCSVRFLSHIQHSWENFCGLLKILKNN